jgi:hypothetical protein
LLWARHSRDGREHYWSVTPALRQAQDKPGFARAGIQDGGALLSAQACAPPPAQAEVSKPCAASREVFLPDLFDGVGICPRQGTHFLSLPRKKVSKERGTLVAGRPRADCSALLGLCGRAELASFAALTTLKQAARSQFLRRAARAPAKPCAARRLRRGPRAIRSLLRNIPCQRLAAHRQAERAAGADAKRAVSAPPSDELSSARQPSRSEGRVGRGRFGARLTWLCQVSAPPLRELSPLSLSTQRKGVGRRAEHPARPHAVNKTYDKSIHPGFPPSRE